MKGWITLKRIISLAVCLLIMLSTVCIDAPAAKMPDPVILISGFMCSQLFTDFGTDSQKKVWGPDVPKILSQAKNDFGGLVSDLFRGKAEDLGEKIADGAGAALEALQCNPDGTSKYEVQHYPNHPETSNVEYLLKKDGGKYLYEKNFCVYMAERVGGKRVFCFQYDSRLEAKELADELHQFIKEVKGFTESDKVSLVALSYGGLITSTYLTFYGNENDVGRVVMSVPALGGTNIPAKILRGDIEVSEDSVTTFVETALGGSSNMAKIFESKRIEWIDRFAAGFADKLSLLAKNWGSFWCLCSQEEYESLKADYLDPVKNAELIRKIDVIHNEVMPKLSETYSKLMAQGMQISIICGTGSRLCLGGDLNGDVILPASGVSGATTAPLGSRFADGYTGIHSACKDKTHNHISPSMEIDASSAYLPENTWFVENHYHGQYYYENYTRSLVTKLLTSDEIKDVYSDPDFPQFANSDNSYRSIDIGFSSEDKSVLSSENNVLIIKNVTDKDYIKVISVVSDETELDFDALGSEIISPGESVEIPFSGKIPEKGASTAGITINFIRIGTLNPFRSLKFDVKLENGKAPGFSKAIVPAETDYRMKIRFSDRILSKLRDFSLKEKFESLIGK